MARRTPQVVTIGYGGRTAAELLEELVELGVRVLVDVRLNPLSHKPGLSKRRLADATHAAGMTYLHLRELGNPKENRDAFRAGDPAARALLRERLRATPAASAIRQVADLAHDGRVALLCLERDHAGCHRELVAEEVLRVDPSLAVRHVD